MILTNASGIPFEPPTPPAPGASIDDVIQFLRAHVAHNDAVSSAANRAFAIAFHKSKRKGRK